MKINKEGLKLIRPGKDIIKQARLAEIEHMLPLLIKPPLNENQFSALASYAMDIGLSGFRRRKIRKILNDPTKRFGERCFLVSKEFDSIAARAEKPNKQKRRTSEKALFLKPVLIAHNPEVTNVQGSKGSP